MRVLRRIGLLMLWVVGISFTLVGLYANHPVLYALRGWGGGFIAAFSIAVAAIMVRSEGRKQTGRAGWMLVLLWCLPPLSLLAAREAMAWSRFEMLRTEPKLAQELGQHFVVGYSSFDEVARLAEKGLIAGVYVSKPNVARRGPAAIRTEIAALQDRRRRAGLPPLIVSADQEGGIVSHLAPPLTALPALANLADLPPAIRAQKAEEYGRTQGREMAALGVNQNFAPVLDLKPKVAHDPFDINTLTSQRAISDNPVVVSEIASAYVHGLEQTGVGATVKHFPGLGRVRGDTHLVSARLDTPIDELEASDWRPFKDVLANSKAQLMIGHVTLSAVDPDRPASHSKAVIDGIIRKRWNYQGVIITDDLVMGAVYGRGICTTVTEALNAGVDLLLVAFDSDQFYRMFACASEAMVQNKLDLVALHDSGARLKQALPTPPTMEASTRPVAVSHD